MQTIDYRYLFPKYGGVTQLFIDYIYNFQNVEKYYALNYADLSIENLIEKVLATYKNRKEISEILLRQNIAFGNTEAKENISLLAEPNTLAIVTGQQVGLFSGPLYTIYKIITAVKVSYLLKDKFPDLNFVPVFYLESEDHDFDEANNIKILSIENSVKTFTFTPSEKSVIETRRPVGEIKFDDGIEKTLSELESELQETEFKRSVLELLRFAYKPGSTFTEAFVAFVSHLFKSHGLIFLNPNDAELKKFLIPVFKKEIETYPKLSELIIKVSADLEENYHAQVKARAINLFMFYRGGRYPIEPADEEGIFRLKGPRFRLTRGELNNIIETNPHLLSPNVILRPICQDTLLPTVCYIAGPSEIAYFAQLKPAYEFFEIPMPVIFPRISATLVEPRAKKVIEKYNIDIKEVYTNYENILKKIISQNAEINLDDVFAPARSKIEEALNDISNAISQIDPTLPGAVENSSAKIFYHINNIYEKALSAQKKKNEIITNQLEKLKTILLPEDELQERVLNIIYFLNKFGLPLIDKLFDELEAFEFNHQIVYL